MVEFLRYPLHAFLIIFFTISFMINISSSLCDVPTDFTSCLTRNGIFNFTLYPNKVETDSATYFDLLNFSIQNLRFARPTLPKPIAIVLPETKEELVNSVLCCRKKSWEIRVRSGGHGYEGTSSVSTDGAPFVIIDMMNLNRVNVDLKSEVAWVEGGATLGQTYYEIAKSSGGSHGFSAGSCPTVGIGGHISGGGFGLLSRRYGLAADNVVDALLIDGDGRLLNREAMGEDVFWAIRGGGGGIWGIVYAWKIQLSKVPQIVTGFTAPRSGTINYVAKLVHKWQYVAPKLEDGFYLSAFVGAGLPEFKTIGISAAFHGFYLGPRTEAVSILKQVFPELGIVEEDCKEMNWLESIVYFSGLENGSSVDDLKDRYMKQKTYFKAKSDFVRTPIRIGGIRGALDILEKEPKGHVIFDPYGGVMENISSESIAFPHRKGNLYAIQYLVNWEEDDNSKSSTDQYMDWIRGFYNWMTPYVSWGPRAAYINYMDLDLGVLMDMEIENANTPNSINVVVDDAVEMARVWGEKYFLKNYDRLVRAKTLIDPYNVFRNQQGIPPMSTSAMATLKSDVPRVN